MAAEQRAAANPRWYQRGFVQAIGLYLLVRFTGIAVLAVFAWYHDESLIDLLHVWDGEWYLAIAEHGYADVPDSLVDADGVQRATTSLAFFPGYPKLVGTLAMLTGLGVVPAALIISLLSGVLAAVALFRIGLVLNGKSQVGLLLVVLWAGAPMAITQSMAYTEGLFTALAAWALLGVLQRQWLLAGLSCLAAGLVRPTASVLIAVVGIAALIAVFQGRNRWSAFAGMLLCPLGLLGYWGYVAIRTGSLTGWFDLEEEGWATRFDAGGETLEFVRDVLVTGSSVMEVVTVFVLLAAFLLVLLAWLNRVPWPLVAYAAGVVITVAGTAGLPFVKSRFLLPAFALLVPVAIGLANRRRSTAIAVTTGFVLFGSWFSAYALTGWEYAI